MLEREKPTETYEEQQQEARRRHNNQWTQSKKKYYIEMLAELSKITIHDLSLPFLQNDQDMVNTQGKDFVCMAELKEKLISLRKEYRALTLRFAEPALLEHSDKLDNLIAKTTSYETIASQLNYSEKFNYYDRIQRELTQFILDSQQLSHRITETNHDILFPKQEKEKGQSENPRVKTVRKTQPTQVASLLDFSDEILLYCCHFLHPAGIAALMLVNSRFRNVTQDETLWREKFNQHFTPAPARFFRAHFQVAYTHHRGELPKKIAELISLLTEGDEDSALAFVEKLHLQFHELETYFIQDEMSLLKYLQVNHFSKLRAHFYEQAHTAYLALGITDITTPVVYQKCMLQWAMCFYLSRDKLVKLLKDNNPLLSDELISVFHLACEQGHLEAVQLFVENSIDINARSPSHHAQPTALILAIIGGYGHIVEYLIMNEANINIGMAKGWDVSQIKKNVHPWIAQSITPLEIAIQMQYFHLFPLLLDGSPSSLRTLHYSMKEIDLPSLQLLIDNNPAQLEVAFCHAIQLGRCDIINWLLDDKHFNVNGNTSLMTPLHLAAMSGHCDVISLLHSKGGNINARLPNSSRPNPLDCAKDETTVQHIRSLGGSSGQPMNPLEPTMQLFLLPIKFGATAFSSLWKRGVTSDKKGSPEDGSKAAIEAFAKQTKRI